MLTAGTIPVAAGGTGAASFTANSVIMSGSSTTAALTTRAIDDATANGALGTGTGLTTERSVYYGLVTVNNASQTRATGIYAPTSAGTAGYILKSSGGTSAPVWLQTLPIANGGTGATSASAALTNLGAAAASHTHSYLPLSGGTLTGSLTGTSAIMSGGFNVKHDVAINSTVSTASSKTISFYDNSGTFTAAKKIGSVESLVKTDGTSELNLTAYDFQNPANGSVSLSIIKRKSNSNASGYVKISYSKVQDFAVRNIAFGSSTPTSSQGENGDIFIKI